MSAALDLKVYERRRNPRYEAWKCGFIYTRRKTPLHCFIENVAETGAWLKLARAAALPARFTLLVPEDEVVLECRAVRHEGRHVGVEFIGGPRCSRDIKL